MKNNLATIIPFALSLVATVVLFGASIAGHSLTPMWLIIAAGAAYAVSIVWFIIMAIQDWRNR